MVCLYHKLAMVATTTTISDESWYGRGGNILGYYVLWWGRNFWCSPEKTATESTVERESKLQELVNSADYSWRIRRFYSTIRCRNCQIRWLVIHAIGVEKNSRDIQMSDVICIQMIDMLTAMENGNGNREGAFNYVAAIVGVKLSIPLEINVLCTLWVLAGGIKSDGSTPSNFLI